MRLTHFLYFLLLTMLFLGASNNSQGQNCEDALDLYERVFSTYNGDEIYMMFTSVTTGGDRESIEIENRIWKNGVLAKYDAANVIIYQDDQTQAVFHREMKTVVLNHSKPNRFQNGFGGFQDSLRNMSESMTCQVKKGVWTLNIKLKQDASSQSGFTDMQLYFTKEKLIQTAFINESSGLKTIYNYKEFDPQGGTQVLAKNVRDQILDNGKLKKEFNDYQLIDLTQ